MKLNSRWRFTVHGRERIPKDRPVVLIANHLGMADILMAFHLGHHFKWNAKQIIFRVPMLGWFMSHAGYIPVKRGDRESIHTCMERARWYLENGVSVLLFPEGTRSEDGELRPFKTGAFRLAIETGCDIVPMGIINTTDALPKRTWRIPDKLADMHLLVGDVIPTSDLTLADVDALSSRSRAAIQSLKDQLQGRRSPRESRRPMRNAEVRATG